MTLPDQLLATTTIDEFKEGAVSSSYGLQSGDRITSINVTAVFVDTDISFNMARDRDGIMDIGVERNGEKLVIEDVQFQTTQVEGCLLYTSYIIQRGFFYVSNCFYIY